MKTKLLTIIFFISITKSFAQIKTNDNIWFAKEFSKDIALFNAKEFLFKNVLGSTTEVVQFEIITLAASSSGELTTLLYKCESKQKEGLF